MIENTSRRDPLLHLLGAMSDGNSKYITDMEAAGQAQMVASEDLPTKSGGDVEYERLGFVFGEPYPHDPLFRPAKLPQGWRRERSDHSMWSYIVDELGRRRVAIFYKAAFYDRDAHMSLETVDGYVGRLCYENKKPVLDDVWATPRQVAEAAGRVVRRATESIELWSRPDAAARQREYAADRVAEARKEIAWAEALISEMV